ncbi:phospholipase D-like domain-containing protein [Geoglobus acetivorans]|uniref:Phospholipase D family protein n=1 Tax=Geoglobus acetivorans TaxID=565033 RepID=A0ABZ3H3N3_GEOAI|nr:phospholipase D family protein [Geoglobus acetivorans]
MVVVKSLRNMDWIILAAVILAMLAFPVKGQNITVDAKITYKMISVDLVEDEFTLKFKNTNENQVEVLNFVLTIPESDMAKVVEVNEKPSGYYKLTRTTDENGRRYAVIKIEKTLRPFEEYQITIKRELRNALEALGENTYSFGTYEFPSYFRGFGYNVERFRIFLDFPDSLFSNYNILTVSSNSKFYYKSLNRIDGIDWDFINPPDQISVYVTFEKVPNFYLLNIMGAFLTVLAFTGLLYYNLRIEKRLKKHDIVKNPPWSGELLSKMKEMIRNAEKEILITSPHIYYTDWLTAELQPLMGKGVKFRIVTWPSYRRDVYKNIEDVQEDRKQFFTLKRFLEMFPPGSVKLNDNIHAKMVIVDEREVLVTTANLSQTGLYENYEIGFYAENPALAKKAKEFFEAVWESEDSISLDHDTIDPKVAWALIMDIKSRREVEK